MSEYWLQKKKQIENIEKSKKNSDQFFDIANDLITCSDEIADSPKLKD